MYEYPAMYLNTYGIARSTHSTLAQSSTEHRIGSGPLQSKVPGGFRLASPDPSSSLTSPAGGSSLSLADTAGAPPATTASAPTLNEADARLNPASLASHRSDAAVAPNR